jgi:DNA repair protein RecO (recombination protein O)
MNELIMKLLPKDESSNDFFNFYHQHIEELSLTASYESLLRVFELKLLDELGYKVKLDQDENGYEIHPKKFYYYEAEYGASLPDASTNGVKIIGQTLIDMHNNDYSHLNTLKESKLLMRYLMRSYTGYDLVKSKELFLTNDR